MFTVIKILTIIKLRTNCPVSINISLFINQSTIREIMFSRIGDRGTIIISCSYSKRILTSYLFVLRITTLPVSSYFKIQPMVATLILFSAGRAIGLLLCNSNIVYINVESFKFFGGYCWIFPTPILITVLCIAVTALVLKFTALGTYVQAVGINKEAARISGYKSAAIIFICYVVCGLFAGIAGITATSRIYSADTNNIGLNLEMDAILAVALGGNSLGGGKFRLSGSIIGAYTIQAITTTLYALGVSSAQAPVFKAVIVILIVTIQSPAVKAYFAKRAAVKNAMMTAGREAQA